MANFQHLQPGEPFALSASDWNAMVDMAKDYHQRRLSMSAPGNTKDFVLDGASWVWVRNDSPAEASLGQPLCLDGLAIFDKGEANRKPTESELNEVMARPTFRGIMPNATQIYQFAGGCWGVCAETIPIGGIGRVVISGFALARVYFEEWWHPRCDLYRYLDKQFMLHSYPGGTAQVIWREKQDYEGTTWAVVSLGNSPEIRYYGYLTQPLTWLIWNHQDAANYAEMEIVDWHYLNKGWGSLWDDYDVEEPRRTRVFASPLLGESVLSNDTKISAIWDIHSHRLVLDGIENNY